MEVSVHTKRGFRMNFRAISHCAYVDLNWDDNRSDEVTFFVPAEQRTRYRRAVEAFRAVLADESIQDDALPKPEPEPQMSDDDMVDF